MTRWLMVLIQCWPHRACVAGHHVGPRACSNTEFPHTKPYLSDDGILFRHQNCTFRQTLQLFAIILLADWRHTHVKCCGAAPGALSAKTLEVGAVAAPTITSALCLQQY